MAAILYGMLLSSNDSCAVVKKSCRSMVRNMKRKHTEIVFFFIMGWVCRGPSVDTMVFVH